jgi:hypothetical protein
MTLWFRLPPAAFAAVLFLSSPPLVRAGDIPAFARRYRVSCQLCHNPIPTLTSFGEQFAANGYRMASGEAPTDTAATNDELLSLLREIPLAARLDLYAQTYANGRAVTDFQSPYPLKILSGGAISKSISYYFYTFLLERGDIGGVEDAFVHVNDIAGLPVDAAVGQFQVSDPLFKRELRLEFEDYAVYRARLGQVPVDLTYDRGVMVMADAAGFTSTFQLLNGSGIGAAQPDRHFDVDGGKNLFLHVTRDLASPVRVGAFGYYGRSYGNGTTNKTRMLAADASVSVGPVELNAQYIHRRDDEPTYTAGEPEVRMDGGFAELILRPGGRWYGFALYNLVTADRPLLDVRLGGATPGDRYESLSGGVGYLLRRNFRLTGEVTHDLGPDETRFTFGVVTAF